MKREKYKKNLTTTIKLFTFFFFFFFLLGKGHIFLENIVWKNLVYTITFLVKLFLVLLEI